MSDERRWKRRELTRRRRKSGDKMQRRAEMKKRRERKLGLAGRVCACVCVFCFFAFVLFCRSFYSLTLCVCLERPRNRSLWLLIFSPQQKSMKSLVHPDARRPLARSALQYSSNPTNVVVIFIHALYADIHSH